jgi:ParB-like chromosome segregation protein Spo0J
MKITKLKLNDKNPRTIKDTKFTQLVRSIENFPKMMQLRPIVVDEHYVILGGNMRYRACLELGMKEIPDEWVKVAKGLTDEEKRRFTIEDNVQFGDWDWDALANEWDTAMLIDFGVDLPAFTVTDERPDFNDTNADKGNRLNAKDGNWFYVEFYGQDDYFKQLYEQIEQAEGMQSAHQIKSEIFVEAFQLWLDAQKGK